VTKKVVRNAWLTVGAPGLAPRCSLLGSCLTWIDEQGFVLAAEVDDMPLFEKITKYSARVGRSDLTDAGRSVSLTLKTGGTAFIGFPPEPPDDWLQFNGSSTTVFLQAEEYPEVYHLLQTEDPVFFTALNFLGIRAASVHTELDLSRGEPTGEGYDDNSLEALIVRARNEAGG
jgi:hypothetical protein